MMNPNKICFITCVTDEVKYAQCLAYLGKLKVPDGIEAEVIAVREESNVAAAYNQGMEASDAKYKVYLHQETGIIKLKFIAAVLKLFRSNPKIGLAGMLGAQKLPTSAKCWQAACIWGCYYTVQADRYIKKTWQNPLQYEQVQCVDGLLMVTQYDCGWDSEFFQSDCFYDIAQSIAFSAAGYQLIVPQQNEPWCLFLGKSNFIECEQDDVYERDRNRFLDRYSNKIFPLVSILIPTYNRPEFLQMALQSALAQTYRHIEILIGDDSTNEETKDMIEPLLKVHHQIKYYYHGAPLGDFGYENCCFIYQRCQGEYVNWLLDDDVFHPEKISKMMEYYLTDPSIALVTSARQAFNDEGKNLSGEITSWYPYDDTILEGKALGRYMLSRQENIVGEVTTALLRKDLLGHGQSGLRDGIGVYFNVPDFVCSDFSTWLELGRKGKVVFIAEKLSAFRFHDAQMSKDKRVKLLATVDWFVCVSLSYLHHCYIETEAEYKQACRGCAWMAQAHKVMELDESKALKHYAKEVGLLTNLSQLVSQRREADIFPLFMDYMLRRSPQYSFLKEYCTKDLKTNQWQKKKRAELDE